ncbi:MAG TPA: hypothetical protein VIK82_00295 [Porticoccaceae bacterium]
MGPKGVVNPPYIRGESGQFVGTTGGGYHPQWGDNPFQALAPGIIKLTRQWVKDAGLSEDEFSELVVAHLERSCSPLKPKISPTLALPILMEVAMGNTPIDKLMGWSREKKDEQSTAAGAPRSPTDKTKRGKEPGPKSGGCLTAIVAAVIAVVGLLFAF